MLKTQWVRARNLQTGDWWVRSEYGTGIQLRVVEDDQGRIRASWQPHGEFDWVIWQPDVPILIVRDS